MEDPDLLKDVRFLRDVVARTQPTCVNEYWPVTLMWGCVLTFGYVVCALLGIAHKVAIIPWVMPALIYLIALPLTWYLRRRVQSGIEERGVLPRCRKDLVFLWGSITAIGLLWTGALIVSGKIQGRWYALVFVWGSLYFIGYIMNGVLLSSEWFWAAGVMLASLVAALVAGPQFYWLPGIWMGGTMVLAGLLGRRNARLQPVPA